MPITKKDTQYGIESWFLVRRCCLLPLLPESLLPYTKFGLGMIVIGIWNHSNVYIDNKSYGPTLEAWVGVGLEYDKKLCGLVHTIYDSNPSYIEPVNKVFKFSKVFADMEWKEHGGRHELEVHKAGKLILRVAGSSTIFPASVPCARPRPAWLIKDGENYINTMKMPMQKTKLAFTSIHIPGNSPMRKVAESLRPIVKFSVFYQNASIEMPLPSKIQLQTMK